MQGYPAPYHKLQWSDNMIWSTTHTDINNLRSPAQSGLPRNTFGVPIPSLKDTQTDPIILPYLNCWCRR